MKTKDHYEMREYNIDVLEDDKDSSFHAKGRPYPIYPSKGGLKPNFLRDIVASALQALPVNVDPIPRSIIQDFGLPSLYDAYYGIHQPKDINEADLARRRLIFDEFFYLQLGRLFQMLESLGTKIEKDGLLDKYRKPESNAAYMQEWSSLTREFVKALPYSLTASQLKAVSEIIWDLKQPVPMNRLLQGDVGCGKTIVAFLACMEVIGSGYQAAFMVPTELLAIQHYEHFNNLLKSVEEVECKPSDLQTGDISMVIGTHSLIAESVEFSALRIAVVDEQHRFGVIQRGRFNSKLYNTALGPRFATANLDETSKGDNYMAPHVLAMSATPIPRTLALALYGDVSLTQITDLPPGRIPVETLIVEGNDHGFENVYKIMLDELQGEGKVYLVYPVIEQSEQLPQLRAASADFEAISTRFWGYRCGLLHGKMKSDEKDEALKRFRCGETQILLATQVIEIGVDVPDASLMVVMNAERFGIAQLHQLRGRVGRGSRKSKCIFIASTSNSLSRLKVLEKSSDGFYLANVDLLLRGPGDLLGKKQSGHIPEFPIARLEADGNLLQEAHVAALKLLGVSHDLEKFPLLKAELSMRQPLSFLGD
ncbi:ATP-dependent DNA helicase RecG [Trema orientale]|uniref:ATP-dependent DNA helicase RecG n=1 Tax=Trema orientale TaxID=63057 RepID=A0A2P5FK59_TREOI|nr:ATP-dependent DNA helicase RecG [Trema orientale]